VVDKNLKGVASFAGEEIDICGRWDAESRNYQTLMASGTTKVPLTWKHKFCHTSVLAVCHSLALLDDNLILRCESGLFLNRCFSCGRKLELSAMHTMVLIAFQLHKYGTQDEDLFGMICCLLQYATLASTSKKDSGETWVSSGLFNSELSAEGCAHEWLSPAKLAHSLSSRAVNCGSMQSRKGWHAFKSILSQIEDQHRWAATGIAPPGYDRQERAEMSSDEEFIRYDESKQDKIRSEDAEEELHYFIFVQKKTERDHFGYPTYCDHLNTSRAFGRNRILGHIWAACQAELLTYRRTCAGQPWLSSRISMDIILHCLQSGDSSSLPFIKAGLLRPYCACGSYIGSRIGPRVEHVCVYDFGNLDDPQYAMYLTGDY
jgi:hypothetical protein